MNVLFPDRGPAPTAARVCCFPLFIAALAVRLAEKIQKLFSPDALASLWEHATRAAHPVDAGRILATIDRDEIARISQLYPRRASARRVNAWDDVGRWIDINVKRAQDLWLDRAPPLRILDLGCGAGGPDLEHVASGARDRR